MKSLKDYINESMESNEIFHLIDESGNKVTMTYEELEDYNKSICEGSNTKTLKADTDYYLSHGYTSLEKIYKELEDKYGNM